MPTGVLLQGEIDRLNSASEISGTTNYIPITMGANGIQKTTPNLITSVDPTLIALLGGYVYVNSIDDFPAANNNTITLAPNISYILCASISTSNRFIIPAGTTQTMHIMCWGQQKFTLVYTGSGALISNAGNYSVFAFQDLILSAPNGSIFNIDTGNTFALIRTLVVDFDTLGSAKNLSLFFSGNTTYVAGDQGATLEDITAIKIGDCRFTQWANNNGTYITYQGLDTVDTFSITGSAFELGASETALNISTSTPITNGQITANNYTGVGTFFAAGSVDQTDINWKVSGNTFVPDSSIHTSISLTNNATATTFSGASTPTKVAGTWAQVTAERFTTNSTGRMTYIGIEPVTANITTTFTFTTSSGANNDYKFYLRQTRSAGGMVDSVKLADRVDSSDFKSIAISAQFNLETNDYIELYCESIGHTISTVVDNASTIINE